METPTQDLSASGEIYATVDANLRPISAQDVIIAVMGCTGSGKSSFINLLTKQNLAVVGHTLDSCTGEVRAVTCLHPDGSGRNLVMVDTPGFDDTNMSDADVLKGIAKWLERTYKQRIKLSGLLFLHRISDNRMAGNPLRNLNMFGKLCGKDALRNVVLMTTMWDEVEEHIGKQREADLRANYWKWMIQSGSRVERFQYTHESACEIIKKFSGSTQATLLQVEMVDRGIELMKTSAGAALFHWLETLIVDLLRKLKRLEIMLHGATKADPDIVTELTLERTKSLDQISQLTSQKEKLLPNPSKPVHHKVLKAVRGNLSRKPSFCMRVVDHSEPEAPIASPDAPRLQRRSTVPTKREKWEERAESPEREGRQGSKIAATITTLRHAASVAQLSPFPGVSGIFNLALTIAETIDASKSSEESLRALAHNAHLLETAINEQLKIEDIPSDTLGAVTNLIEELKQVKAIVERLLDRGSARHYFLQAEEATAIASCCDRIQSACHRFQITTALSTRQALHRMEARMQKVLDGNGSKVNAG